LLNNKKLSELKPIDFKGLMRANECEYPEIHENEHILWYYESKIDDGPDAFDYNDLVYDENKMTIKEQEFNFTGVQKMIVQVGERTFEIDN
jgi:hypothetical protein